MKVFRLFSLALWGVVLSLLFASCEQDNIEPDGGGKTEHPNGIPSNIPTNTIYYITYDDFIIPIKNENKFGGAKIVSNTYSSSKGYGTIKFASEVTSIDAFAFEDAKTMTYIALPNSVKSIGGGAFLNCSGLTSVTIPNSVTSIGDNAFEGCSGLTSVSIPNSVTSIGDGAFSYCSGLTSVTIPNSVKSIGYDAFYGCTGLTSVHISDIAAWCKIKFVDIDSNPLNYARHLFLNGKEVKELSIPNSVTSIGYAAFQGCSGLTSVTIPNSVTRIGGCAFYDCSGLTSVSIPNSVTSIGDGAFSYCSGLTSVTIPNSVTSIGSGAFDGCSGLTSVTIPNSVTSIGDFAFYDCSGLLDVYCYAEEVPSAGDLAFLNSNYTNATLHVPAGSIESYKSTEPWSLFGKIVALN